MENLKVPNPRANGGGSGAMDWPRPEAEDGLCAAASLPRQREELGAEEGGRRLGEPRTA